MNYRLINLSCLIISIILLFTVASCKQQDKEEWLQLFNGENLDGWDIKIRGYDLNENVGNTFRVEDGLLKVRYNEYDSFNSRFGHIFFKKQYSHYIIRVEYRFVGKQCSGGQSWALRNSGIMLHGQPANTMEKNQDFPVSLEVQLLGGDSTAARSTANLCTPGTNVIMSGELQLEHCLTSNTKTYYDNEWVTVEVEVRGGEVIRHIIDGKVVMEYNTPQLDDRDPSYEKMLKVYGDKLISKGSISLQSESHPIDFRKVELKVLELKELRSQTRLD